MIASKLPSLGKVSAALFFVAFVVFVAGMVKTTVSAPCSDVGALITLVGLGIAAVACTSLLVRTFMHRSGKAWALLAAGVVATGFAIFVAFLWTILLCRGV